MHSKAALRKKFSQIPPTRSADALIVQNILKQFDLKQFQSLMLFNAILNEPDLSALFAQKIPKIFPKVIAGSHLEIYEVNSLDQFALGHFNISEPDEKKGKKLSLLPAPCLILVPALAYDVFGSRLGKGKGYYDRFLANLDPQNIKCGVCFENQLSATPLPLEAHDVGMDYIVTEKRAFKV